MHSFYVTAEGGIKLWINEELVIDDWNSSGAEKSGNITLESGKLYEIKMEYAKDPGDEALMLEWETDKLEKNIVPTSQLYSSETVTAIEDQILNNDSYKIYPVPAEDVLNIRKNNFSFPIFEEFYIYNNLGSMVLKQKPELIDSQQWQINVSALPAGIYFIQQTENGHFLKFLKK